MHRFINGSMATSIVTSSIIDAHLFYFGIASLYFSLS